MMMMVVMKMMDLMYEHANLGEEEPTTGRHPAEVAAEACRCMVNLLHHSRTVLEPRFYARGMSPLLRALERELDPIYRIALLRLLFNCSLEKVNHLALLLMMMMKSGIHLTYLRP